MKTHLILIIGCVFLHKKIDNRKTNKKGVINMYVRKNSYIIAVLLIISMFLIPNDLALGKEKKKTKENNIELPDYVLPITKENTFPNSSDDQEVIEPSKLTKQLIDDIDIPIDNLELIKLLNETTLNPSPIAVGYRGNIYLGRWPLNYKTEDMTVNWEYQFVNENELNNLTGDVPQEIRYNQQEEREIKGALTSKVAQSDQVKKMILRTAQEKTKLPLSFKTVIGANTKKEQYYNIPAKKIGYLHAHAPAVNEKGQITYGEIYIQLKGSQKSIVIKNVTKQGVGAWIPIQDHLAFSFKLK